MKTHYVNLNININVSRRLHKVVQYDNIGRVLSLTSPPDRVDEIVSINETF